MARAVTPCEPVIHTPSSEAGTGFGEPTPEPLGPSAGEELLADERRELRLVVPFRDGEKRSVTLEWSDTRYELVLDGTSATLTWAGVALPHRRACQALLDENQKVLAAAQKLDGEGRLLPAETRHLPKFGVCQPAGLGSWALSLAHLTGRGDGAARTLVFELEAARVNLDGKRESAPFGSFEVAPGGLELASLQVYDFDDDGHDELVVPYELKALPAGGAPAAPSAIWSFGASGIAPYAKAPAVAGGVSVEQLDFDMRPDLGSYGPFVAWLGADCGMKSCPTRVTGPRFFFHAQADGGFASDDDATRAALKRACPRAPTSILVRSGAAVNLDKTAKNLVCARVQGTTADAIRAELAEQHADLCGDTAACSAASALEAWLVAPLPLELTTKVAAE